MKIRINDKVVFKITKTMSKILKHTFFEEEYESEVERLVCWVLQHQIDNIVKDLRVEWMPKLKDLGVENMPLDDEKFAELVFSQKEYKNRSGRDKKFPDKISSISDLPLGR
jgi:hypothetical protein